MDINGLQAFIAVAETGAFSRAGERLHLTQPAVSKRVAALEAEVGARLFDRVGRRIALTEAGTALLPRARRILEEVEDSRRALGNLSGRVAGRLSVGTSHHIGLHRLPPILRTYITRHPDVELDLHFMDSEAACRAVEHGDLELGIVTLPLEPAEVLESTMVWPDPMAVVAGADHPFALSARADLADLAAHTAVLPAAGTYTRVLLERALAPAGLELKVGLSTNYLETIKMLVSVGLGWSVLPLTMLDDGIRRIDIDDLRLARDLGVVRHTGRTLTNAARALLELLTPVT